MRSWKNPPFIVEKKLESVLPVPNLKTMVKWTLVLIYGRLYKIVYSQGKIIFESQITMVFNKVLGKIFLYSSFSRSVKKKWVASSFGLRVILGGSLFFQITVNCSYIVKLDPR